MKQSDKLRMDTINHIFEDSDEKLECKQDAKNLYHKMLKPEYTIVADI